MAEFINASSRLSLRVQIGTNDEGRPILRSLSLRDVSADAVADDVVAVSSAIGALLDHPIVETSKIDTDLVA
ncbi:MAG: DUF1659 domain-containing protein [Thermovirgaceae bacterium]|jgi:hypothetical protein|nr:DUF1659 domain-containing protein [Synergistales bacterium]MDD3525036.1 DUF1659 domain-containing protein [Candidatus Cloacimonadota bacterium]MDD5515765.1 DUF1659 domain-containing protein [Synergistales bacterium]MDI9393777.1 DUF1659 domain-containing protein [Synergistota bacterium]HRV72098.1 DUF1659 domain-containing protein [Thermovirgaceae bacterium]